MKLLPITSRAVRIGLLAAGLAACASVGAQSADADTFARAQQQFDAAVTQCNTSGLPEPQRAACIREAGLRFDRLRGMPAVSAPAPSADGRATVMTPTPQSRTLQGSTTATTADGRATVVVPGTATTP